MNEDMQNVMVPKPEDIVVRIPMTLEVPKVVGFRRFRSRLWVSLILSVVDIIAFVAVFASDMPLAMKFLLAPVVLYFGLWGIRILVLEEPVFRKDMEYAYSNDFVLPYSFLWNIFSIDDDFPHYCHFRNGMTGVFVMMEKDVRIGRDSVEDRFEHYNSIADAYREVGMTQSQLVHIDYMSVVGEDPRIRALFNNVNESGNEDLRNLLTAIYTNVEEQSQFFASTYDVYLILTRNHTEGELWQVFENFRAYMLDANYLAAIPMNAEGIRQLTTTLFNMHDFSMVQASLDVLSESSKQVMIPLYVIHSDGSYDKLGSTPEEEKEEAKRKAELIQAKKAEVKRRKSAAKRSRKSNQVTEGQSLDDLFKD